MTAPSHASMADFATDLIGLCEQMLARYSPIEPQIVRHEQAFFNIDVPDSPRTIRTGGKDEYLNAISSSLESGPVICIAPLMANPKTGVSSHMLRELTCNSEHPLLVISTWT